ncbi:MAG TPA: ZIP family metal transporter [Candidatus Diapherotrites archaeon]|jgi:zinc and cadmium transporter|nr:ZIP family metal transporter [Candidatus Diapherotrites archaeon]
MLSVILYSLISILIISTISIIGITVFFTNEKKLPNILLFLISFSAGALLGDAFIHLLPEAMDSGINYVPIAVISGILAFFVLEKFVQWRHCHQPTSKEHPHPLATMNLVGDAFHNFLDGVIIATSYVVSIPLGIATTVAVLLHEIPQEIGDFGVLVYAGYSKKKALLMNFIISLTALLGGIVGLLLSKSITSFSGIMIAFTAGGFIYIATADLIPEMKKDTNFKKTSIQLIGLLLGIGIMLLMTLLE